MSAITSSTETTLKNIMVATDLTHRSVCSLPFVMAISRRFHSTVFLAHVISLGTFQVARPESFDAVEAQCRNHTNKELNRLSAQIGDHGVLVQTLIGEGDVAQVICSWVDQKGIDMVAVGTSGRTGLRKLALGSIAEEVIRLAPCPVLTVGPCLSTRARISVGSILYATDLSPFSIHAGHYACSLASGCDARLIILHVTQEHITPVFRQSLNRQVRDLIPKSTNLTAQPDELIARGRPAQKILEVTNELSIDLIVMGLCGEGVRRGYSHFGSTAHEVIVGASCPVLVVGAPRHQLKRKVDEWG